MSWKLFRWMWRLESPLFVGAPPAGALNRCRLYVPARAVWGAVTAELARREGIDARVDGQKYRSVGDELRKNVRFSYLYPAESLGGRWLAWLPEYRRGGGLVWVREDDANRAVADRGFRRWLLWTRPATAIDPDNDSALEDSLRETECIEPYWRRGEDPPKPVAMVGYVFIRDDSAIRKDMLAIQTLFIGGDTRYGLGRLEQITCKVENSAFGKNVELGREEPVVQSTVALAHTRAQEVAMIGALESLMVWDSGKQMALNGSAIPLWTPGSRPVESNGSVWVRIDEQGIWHARLAGRTSV